MDSKIAFFAFVVAIAVALPAARAMSCYECSTSMSDENSNCTSLMNIQASQCNAEYFTKINKLNLPQEILRIFDGFRMAPGALFPDMKWRCAKLAISGKMNGPTQTNYTIRTCLPEMFNSMFCSNASQVLNTGSPNYNNFHVEHCSTCDKDICNSASSMSLTLLPILAIFALSSYILKA